MQKLKVLVAEDNLINQQLLITVLEMDGHSVEVANNGVEVISLLGEKDFDVVLMDVQMPMMDGVETTKVIRSSNTDKFDPQIPIIAITANSLNGDREKLLDVGMSDYISKPINFEKLKTTLKQFR